jgi:hypothetical protein
MISVVCTIYYLIADEDLVMDIFKKNFPAILLTFLCGTCLGKKKKRKNENVAKPIIEPVNKTH